jgi:nicotinamidase-related amidase
MCEIISVDWCVFCTAQELCWRGYKVRILAEGRDTVGGVKLINTSS